MGQDLGAHRNRDGGLDVHVVREVDEDPATDVHVVSDDEMGKRVGRIMKGQGGVNDAV